MSDEVNQTVATITPVEPEKKRCVYYAAFTEEEKTFYEQVRDVEALDDEIVMLRVKIFALVARDPENMTLLLRSLMCLDRLCRTNVKDYKRDSFDLNKCRKVPSPCSKASTCRWSSSRRNTTSVLPV